MSYGDSKSVLDEINCIFNDWVSFTGVGVDSIGGGTSGVSNWASN